MSLDKRDGKCKTLPSKGELIGQPFLSNLLHLGEQEYHRLVNSRTNGISHYSNYIVGEFRCINYIKPLDKHLVIAHCLFESKVTSAYRKKMRKADCLPPIYSWLIHPSGKKKKKRRKKSLGLLSGTCMCACGSWQGVT